MHALNPVRSLGICAMAGAGADLMLVANGLDLSRSRFPGADLAQSGMSPGTVAMHGAVLVVLGVLPVIALLALLVTRLHSAGRDRLSRAALGVFVVAQSIAGLAALATTL